MKATDALRVFRRRWWVLPMTALIGATAAAGVDAVQPPRYRATTRLLVAAPAASVASYALLVTSDSGVGLAVDDAGVSGDHPRVTATAEPGVPALTVTAEADTADAALALASAYRETLPRIIRDLQPVTNAPSRTVAVTVLTEPALPGGPSVPRPLRDLPIGAGLAVLVGLCAAVARQSMHPRLHTTADLERVADGLLLGAVPRQRQGSPSLLRRAAGSGAAQAYGRLRATLEHCGPHGLTGAMAVTAATCGEGASSVAANLGRVAAETGRRVVLVDADLHRPSQDRRLGVPAGAGLAEVVLGSHQLDDVLVPVGASGLTLLRAGQVPVHASQIVGSEAMVEVIEQLTRRFDLVLVDVPAVLALPDALAVGAQVDGVVLVARMGAVAPHAVRRAVDALRRVGADVLGVVANAALAREERAYGTAFRPYGATTKAPATDDQLDLIGRLSPAIRRREPAAATPAGRRGRRIAASPVDQAGRPTPPPEPAAPPVPPVPSASPVPPVPSASPVPPVPSASPVSPVPSASPVSPVPPVPSVSPVPSAAMPRPIPAATRAPQAPPAPLAPPVPPAPPAPVVPAARPYPWSPPRSVPQPLGAGPRRVVELPPVAPLPEGGPMLPPPLPPLPPFPPMPAPRPSTAGPVVSQTPPGRSSTATPVPPVAPPADSTRELPVVPPV